MRMNLIRTAKDTLTKCDHEGQIKPRVEVDIELVTTLLELAEGDQQAGAKLAKGLEEKNILWNNVYIAYYDALHKLVEAYLIFDKISSLNHLCLFAYLCEKHPELELDWNFFEKIRTKRNGIHYYGQKVNQEDWKSINLQIKLYISTLKKALREKLP